MNAETLKIRWLFVVAGLVLFLSAVYTVAVRGVPVGPVAPVLAAVVLCSFAMRPMSRNEAHNSASILCVFHAAFVSYCGWNRIGPDTDIFNNASLYYTLVFAWMAWLVVLPILWSFTGRKWWKLLVPLGLGALALLPALADLTATFSFLIHGPGL